MLDLMSVLSEKETSDLSNQVRQKEAKKKTTRENKLKRKMSLRESLGVHDSIGVTVDWIPQETITFWRRWTCQCGEAFSGPAYDSNPVWVRLEKMRTHRWNIHLEEFVKLKLPVPLKGRPSCYKRGTYQHLVRHSIQYMDTQLWSCPSCKSKVVHTQGMCTPWSDVPEDDDHIDCNLSLPLEDLFISGLSGDARMDLDNPIKVESTDDGTVVEGRKLIMLRIGERFLLQDKSGVDPDVKYSMSYSSPVGPLPRVQGRFQIEVPA